MKGREEGRGWYRNANEEGRWMKVSRTLQGHSCFVEALYLVKGARTISDHYVFKFKHVPTS